MTRGDALWPPGWLAASPTPDWRSLPSLLPLGNGGAGLSAAVVSCCPVARPIPYGDAVDPLHMAVAGALLLFERWRTLRCACLAKASHGGGWGVLAAVQNGNHLP